MPLNWNFPAKIGPKTGKQVSIAKILVLADFVTVLRELGVLPVLPAAPP
jgi:hypothetical protein